MAAEKKDKTRWALFASGQGTNLQNVLELEAANKITGHSIVLIHTNRECEAAERGLRFHKPVFTKSTKDSDYDEVLLKKLSALQVDKIFLLGYMKILSAAFIKAWSKPIVNLHPSLLPKYKGLNAIERSFESQDEKVGVSLHLVTPELDSGDILRQIEITASRNQGLKAFETQIRALEHQIVREYLSLGES